MAPRNGSAGGPMPPFGPPLSRNLRDSGFPFLLRCGGYPPAFQRFPVRAVLLPERFRGPVAPSAAGEPALSRAEVREHDTIADPAAQFKRAALRERGWRG